MLLLIALAALGVRLAFTLAVDPAAGYPSDADNYHRLGLLVSEGRGYLRPLDLDLLGYERATAEYPPLLPFLLGGLAAAGIDSVEGQEVVLSFAGTATVVLLGLLGRRLAGDRAGWLAAGFAAVYPMLFQADAVLMTESLAALLVTVCLLLAYRAIDRPTPARFAVLGATLGVAALARSELLLLALLLVVPLAWRTARPSRDTLASRSWRLRRRAARATLAADRRRLSAHALLRAGAGLGAMLVVLAPWTVRNAVRFDTVVPVSNNLGTVLDGANCDLTYGGAYLGSWRSQFGEAGASDFSCFEGFHVEDPAFDEAAAAATHRRAGLRYAADHAGRLPAVTLARLGRTWGMFRVSQQIDLESLEGRDRTWERWGTFGYWVLMPFALTGLVVLHRRRVRLWPLLATAVLVTVTTMATYGNQRFRIAAEPAIVAAAAVGVTALAGWLRGRREPVEGTSWPA